MMKSKFKLLALLLLLAGLAVGFFVFQSSPSATSLDESIFATIRGPMEIKVIETGTLKPQEQLVITNKVEGLTTILSLVAEGTKVKEGDLLVELDSSQLIDSQNEQEIRVQNSESSYVRSREDFEVAKSQAESDVSKAELDYRFAKEDLLQYKDGEYPNKLNDAESRIALAEEEQKRASEKLKWSDVLSKEKYISNTELQADQLAEKRSKLEMELAKNNLNLLKVYTHPRRLDVLNSAISQTALALERVKRKAKASVIQAEIELKTREIEWTRQKDKLVKIIDQIEKTKILAPMDGIVVYASSTKTSWRGGEALQEGQQIRERQELIYLPTNQGMKAEFNLHETQLDMISLEQRASISVDAIPNKNYTGSVMSIAPLPDATQMYFNPDLKVYLTQVNLDGYDEALRTGMNCKIEVLVDHYEDVLQIPIQAVVRSGNTAIVYVRKALGGFAPKRIQIGQDNGAMIHIISGLLKGEEVWLTPPLEAPDEFKSKREPLPPLVPKNNYKKSSDGLAKNKIKREHLSEETKQKMQERLKNLSPEEREKMRNAGLQKRNSAEVHKP